MLASTFISNDIFPLKKTDTCETALVFMHDWKVQHLPVVNDGKLLGYVAASDLNDHKAGQKIDTLIKPLTNLYLLKSHHLFEVLAQMSDSGYTCLAVCDEESNYKGAVTMSDMSRQFSGSTLSQPGAIVVLRMHAPDYSLAELARIVEYNDCKIINVFIQADVEDASRILVSLKLNKQSITSVIQTLERYQYQIFSVHQMETKDANLDDRYDWLLKYLNT